MKSMVLFCKKIILCKLLGCMCVSHLPFWVKCVHVQGDGCEGCTCFFLLCGGRGGGQVADELQLSGRPHVFKSIACLDQ